MAPHAPYTASVELFRLAKHCSEELGMPFTTHIAESLDEHEMFLEGRGELYDFLSKLGRNMDDCGHGSPLSHLMEFGLLNERCLAVHLNYLQEYDLAHLRQYPLNIVHCPQCHDYFGHRRFPLEDVERTGCKVMIGTDSLASNHSLDLRSEIRHAAREYPGIGSRDWLHKVTSIPAEALGMENQLGVIQPAALADLVAFSLPDSRLPEDPYRYIIESTQTPDFILVNGVQTDLKL
ncbi:MAG: amidohydrolase family protein [Verrucomicrobiota bacterium]